MRYAEGKVWLRCVARFAPILLVLATLGWHPRMALAQAQPTPTATATPGGPSPIVTNNYTEAVNVRAGPGSLYPYLGNLPVGATAQAVAVSPKHEWIEISFPEAPGGLGWVYAAFVELSPGYLRVVEPPPTVTPLASATLDPTLAAAFQLEPTVTRLPTFTPPPPLIVPTFGAARVGSAAFPAGLTIAAFVLFGGLVLAASFLGRR